MLITRARLRRRFQYFDSVCAYKTNISSNTTQREYAQRAQTSAEHGMTQLVSNTEDPDFGLWTPGSEA